MELVILVASIACAALTAFELLVTAATRWPSSTRPARRGRAARALGPIMPVVYVAIGVGVAAAAIVDRSPTSLLALLSFVAAVVLSVRWLAPLNRRIGHAPPTDGSLVSMMDRWDAGNLARAALVGASCLGLALAAASG